jgi:hypothetical protein
VTYILRDFGVPPGFVVMGLAVHRGEGTR